MINGKIIVLNNRMAQEAKRALDMHAAKRRGAQLEAVIWTAVGAGGRAGTCLAPVARQ